MNSLLDDNNSMLLQEHEMSCCSEVGTRMSLRISSSSVNVGFVQLAQKFIDIVAQRCKVDDKVSRNFSFFFERVERKASRSVSNDSCIAPSYHHQRLDSSGHA